MTVWNRNTEALDQMAVGPVREHEGDAVEPDAEVQLCLWVRIENTQCTHAEALEQTRLLQLLHSHVGAS